MTSFYFLMITLPILFDLHVTSLLNYFKFYQVNNTLTQVPQHVDKVRIQSIQCSKNNLTTQVQSNLY